MHFSAQRTQVKENEFSRIFHVFFIFTATRFNYYSYIGKRACHTTEKFESRQNSLRCKRISGFCSCMCQMHIYTYYFQNS